MSAKFEPERLACSAALVDMCGTFGSTLYPSKARMHVVVCSLIAACLTRRPMFFCNHLYLFQSIGTFALSYQTYANNNVIIILF